MQKLEDKAIRQIKERKAATEYIRSILVTNVLFIVILLITLISNINMDDMVIFWCNIAISFGVTLGIIADVIIIFKLYQK